MKSFASLVTVVVVFLLFAGTTEAETISVTLHAADPQTVTFSDGSGEYFTDWRIWKSFGETSPIADDGSPAIADEKAGATNIGDVNVSQGTRPGGNGTNSHFFNYTDADTLDGSGATNFTEAFKLCGVYDETSVSLTFSTSDIGPAGTLYVYSGGWASANRLDAEIGSESVSVNRSYDETSYSDWWEINYSGVTDPQATLDITMTTTSHWHDLQLYAAALDVVPEPSMLVGLVGVALTGTLGYFWRRRYSARR